MNNNKFPLKMHIPPNRANQPCLTLPTRQWQWLPDGSIDVMFDDREQLKVCVAVTTFLRDYEQKTKGER